jgi:hypothetical protein
MAKEDPILWQKGPANTGVPHAVHALAQVLGQKVHVLRHPNIGELTSSGTLQILQALGSPRPARNRVFLAHEWRGRTASPLGDTLHTGPRDRAHLRYTVLTFCTGPCAHARRRMLSPARTPAHAHPHTLAAGAILGEGTDAGAGAAPELLASAVSAGAGITGGVAR